MKRKLLIVAAALCCLCSLGAGVRADTYSKFQTTRYHSANRQHFVVVSPSKRIALYRSSPRRRLIWAHTLPELPGRVLVTNDGKRVVLIDRYYGNDGAPELPVVQVLGENGAEIASYPLSEVANLARAFRTVSSAWWFYAAYLTADGRILVIETGVRKCPLRTDIRSEEDLAAADECDQTIPYEELRFATATGALLSRSNIEAKYADPGEKLRHDVMLYERAGIGGRQYGDALIELARHYNRQKNYRKAAPLFNQGIVFYNDGLRIDYSGLTAAVMADAAYAHQGVGDYRRAERLYRRALRSVDKGEFNPKDAHPVVVEIYRKYATMLRMLKRNKEADTLEGRAKAIVAANPSYKPEP